MHRLYSLLLPVVKTVIPVVGLFNNKLQKSITGREQTLHILDQNLDSHKPTIWLHAASLGEYEQGVPVLEALQNAYPDHQWVITFFSPSGYEVKKDNAFAKATVYLPLDTPSNVREFLDLVDPEMVFFIKYEFWPNYLIALKRRKIRTFLISGVFRESQPFFKFYGRWMVKCLETFEHFFLQDQSSGEALEKLGFSNYTLSGDTRFDRVSHQIEMENRLDFVEAFKGTELCVVCGSTWPEDEEVIASYINNQEHRVKFIIAPHEINEEKIETFIRKISVPVVRYSRHEKHLLNDFNVLIIDTVGLLAKIYSYADVAYVGGAMGTTGLHNILEPATFGIPILIGNNFEKFPEAKKLQQLAGLYTVSTAEEFTVILNKLIADPKFRSQTGMIAGHFINSNTGATKTIREYFDV